MDTLLVLSIVYGLISGTLAQAGVSLPDLQYSHPDHNENAQVLPIPSIIGSIVYPTIGTPSLVQSGARFSVILSLKKEQFEKTIWNARLGTYLYSKRYTRLGPYEVFYRLAHDYESRWPKINRAAKVLSSRWHDDQTLILVLQAPDGLDARAYDLTILGISDQGKSVFSETAPHVVGVLQKKETYRFIHFADTQLNDTQYNLEQPREARVPDLISQEFLLDQAREEMNFLKPDFALMSGDLVSGANHHPFYQNLIWAVINAKVLPPEERRLELSAYANEYSSIVEWLRQLNFPTFLAPGNHDGFAAYTSMNESSKDFSIEFSPVFTGRDSQQQVLFDGKHYWRRMLGPLYYSFDFGAWHIASLDTYDQRRVFRAGYSSPIIANHGGGLSQEQLAWLRRDLAAATAAGKKIILTGHHDPRGGAMGEHLFSSKYKKKLRVSLPLDLEMEFLYRQSTEDPLYTGQEWTSHETEFLGYERPDGDYDSSTEFLKLIKENNVTHFLLGHTHGDYVDNVDLGDGRKVLFIHTTSVAAPTSPIRGTANTWGYRLFEIAFDGSKFEELYTMKDGQSIPLGKLRVQHGYNENYKTKVKGILSESRPWPNWMPHGNVVEGVGKIKDQLGWRWPFGRQDPFLFYSAMMRSAAKDYLEIMDRHQSYGPIDFEELAKRATPAYGSAQRDLGPRANPKRAWVLNGLSVRVEGQVETAVRKVRLVVEPENFSEIEF